MDRYPVVILDRPIRIFDFKPIPLLCLIAASLVALKLSLFVNPNLYIGGLPLNLLTFICAFSLIAGNVKALELRPVKWWLRRLRYIREPLPVYLPEEAISPFEGRDSLCSCLKINSSDLIKLDDVQRLKIADLIVDFANDYGSLQIYSPPGWGQENSEQRDFYMISKLPLPDIDRHETGSNIESHAANLQRSRFLKLAHRISKLGLEVAPVKQSTIRKLLFSQLSPSHTNILGQTDSNTRNSIENGNDLLSLCVSGFEHMPRHILIDNKYVTTIHLTSLPLEANFGLLDKLLSRDLELSFSMYLRPCNIAALKRQARMNWRLGTTIKSNGPITPPAHLAQIKAFCETEMTAISISISATIFADDLETLEKDLGRARRAVSKLGATLDTSYAEELEAMISGLPICEDLSTFPHITTAQAAGQFIPFL